MNLMKIQSFWNDVHEQRWDKLPKYFHVKAVIVWPNTNEQFNVDSFVLANSEYPGKWDIELYRTEQCGQLLISVVLVKEHNSGQSFYATSFFECEGDLIIKLTEYWGENGEPPEWRRGWEIN